jgi:LacI family transcriptional regulator
MQKTKPPGPGRRLPAEAQRSEHAASSAAPEADAAADAAHEVAPQQGSADAGHLSEVPRVELPGDRRPTINDIARLADVSKKTVSRVINDSPFVKVATRAKIDAIIRQIGFAPDPQARGLAFRRSFLVGLVYDNPNASYIVNILDGVLDALKDSDFELVVHPCDRFSPDFIPGVRRFIQRHKLRGVILLPPISENNELARALKELDCEHVRVASVLLDDTSKMIVANDREGAAEAANYLEALGHRHIGFIAGPPQYRSSRERLEGFSAALEKRGLRLPPEMIVEGAYSFDSGVTCAEALLVRRPRPTAIFASNDEMAGGVYKAAYRMRIQIPEALSVVGFDDSSLASRLAPALTTIRQPIRDMGRLAAMKLLPAGERGASDELVSRVMLHLVVRDSSRPPP